MTDIEETTLSIARATDWENRLATYLDRVADEPFGWGTNDCALFVAGAIKAMSADGVDLAAAVRGTYQTKTGAALALRDHAAGTLLRTVRAWVGADKPVSLAKRGDVVMLGRTAIGICVGQYSWFVGEEFGRAGLHLIPTSQCRYAFSVPFDVEGAAHG
ncbi:hypothetical protein SAMN06297144_1882 [Sphingomonas guangdongensis]|uniref:DUF6950 domain-containing protein n=1 Tax=Sphingomonas guangdongensis TaxID=1141890 RepID=A0A285QXY4_9SPHN|nr:hypothetical protein [Sphingomonas guangdongensis]SOB86773.1 hypothetical protein SAMN06297144_1882 [Sphingomonas guangdongensis]